MSKLTNKFNLPEAIVEVLTPKYEHIRNPKTYYVTDLTKDPRQVHLGIKYSDKIIEDVSDKIWALVGKAIHYIIEKMSGQDRLKEERLEIEMLGRKIIGRADDYSEKAKNVLRDWKITSVWSYIYGSSIQSWTEQLNIYDYMFHSYGFEIDELEAVVILRDWSKGKASKGGDYPPVQIQVIKIKKWSHQEQEDFIKDRLQKLIDTEELEDDKLPLCSKENRWAGDDQYAIMKEGRKSALRVVNTKSEAVAWEKGHLEQKPNDKTKIVLRKGEDRKCKDYCNICQWCNYWKENYKEK